MIKNKESSVKAPKRLKENECSPLAIEVVKKLKQSGFQGYLVGGCVRDSLAGIKAKDFDWGDKVNTHIVASKDALLRSPLAHFNPKYAGVGAGSVLSADLMAGEITLEEYKKMLKKLQDKGLLND